MLHVQARYHNPNEPLNRSVFQQIFIYFIQLLTVFQVYYLFSKISLNFDPFLAFYDHPNLVLSFPVRFWAAQLAVILFAKIFNRYVVLCAILGGELFFQLVLATEPFQYTFFIFLVLVIISESLTPYQGGEYDGGKHIFHQLGRSILPGIVYLPILYFTFQFSPNPVNLVEDLNFIRFYLILLFFVDFLIIVILQWIIFWFLDRKLRAFFPLSKEEQEEFDKLHSQQNQQHLEQRGTETAENRQTWEQNFENYLPQPGELYLEILTHHSLEEDDHTVVIRLGKVRIYLCTRCSAMVFGVIFSFLCSILFFRDLGLEVNLVASFWMGVFLPLLPLMDWGFQALHIRKANTVSRLITGFILGFSMQLIPFAMAYSFYYFIIVVSYFLVFGLMYYFRIQISRKRAENESLQEMLKENSFETSLEN